MTRILVALLLSASAEATGRMSPTSDLSSNRVRATGASQSRSLADHLRTMPDSQLDASHIVTGTMAAGVVVSDASVAPDGTATPQTIRSLASQVHGNPGATLYVNSNAGSAWNSGTAYALFDRATSAGVTYVALQPGTNHAPASSPLYWAAIAAPSDANPCTSWAFACKTILGAHDKLDSTSGGTIYFADNSLVGGEVANQGLWFMGSTDPQWNGGAIPSGWRKAKPLRLVGVGNYVPQFARAPVARILGGQSGAWARDVNKPGLWVSGSSASMVFDNIAIGDRDLYRAVILAVPSNRNTSDPWIAPVTFNSSYFSVQAVGEIPTDLARGPAVEAQHVFWAYFNDCVFLTNGNFSPPGPDSTGLTGAQRGAAVAVVPRSGVSGGLVMKRSVSAMGGLHYTAGGTEWGVIVDDWTLESDGVTSVAPVVLIDQTSTAPGKARIINVANSDAPGSDTAVAVVPASADQANVFVSSVGSTRGPVHYADGDLTTNATASRATTLTQDRAIGMVSGRSTARSNSGHRLGAPSASRFANLITAAPTTAGNWTITSGVADPLGGTGAFRAATVSQASVDTLILPPGLISKTLTVGDALIACGWIRTVVGVSPVQGDPLVKTGSVATNNRLDRSGTNTDSARVEYRTTNEWNYFAVGGVFDAIGTATTTIGLFVDAVTLTATNEGTFEMFMPTLHYIPTGTMAKAELHEFLNHGCNPLPYGTPASMVSYPAATPMWSPGTTFSALGTPSNGALIYCSDCTIANPCAGSGTGAFAKRLNGAWVCN